MARVKIEITLSSGAAIKVEKEISDEQLSTFDEIEDFTTELKRSMLPKIQSDLLSNSQKDYKKK
jgi:hypothetical protein